jgi:hypothetical protein
MGWYPLREMVSVERRWYPLGDDGIRWEMMESGERRNLETKN